MDDEERMIEREIAEDLHAQAEAAWRQHRDEALKTGVSRRGLRRRDFVAGYLAAAGAR